MKNKQAFTLIELLVVIAIIAILAGILLPALARAKQQATGANCISAKKQMQVAWTMYANDFGDRLAFNNDQSQDYEATHDWAEGILDWSTNPENTNYMYLIDPRVSSMGPYVGKNYLIEWCPADIYVGPHQTPLGWSHRCRSISMDGAVGDGKKYTFSNWGGVQMWWAKKMSDLIAPGTAQSWVFSDEHPDSIDDEIMYIDPGCTNGTGTFTELPASYHNLACGVSFADGHVELHKWFETETVHPVTYSDIDQVGVTRSRDLAWLAQRTPHAPGAP
jgi:prepilin-type N-terminal cleavage/methylation domain-containing protein/prepilin-type processing-associated H-X9-DG protein